MSPDPLRILAIDNEHLLLKALERAGKGRSFEIKTAATTRHALDEIDCCDYDLFMLDFDIDDQERQDLLQTIDERCPFVPIIIMTTSDRKSSELNEAIRSRRKQGSWHLLEKPFSLDRLISFVDVIFQNRGSEKFCPNSLSVSYDQEKRYEFRRPHVQPVKFSFKSMVDGVVNRISANGILTDISDCGSGILAHRQMHPEQVISFEDEFIKQNGIVAWSVMVDNETCRFGVQFC
ncbi:MAG TPA: response regulator [Geothermobacteraceae bacterium]|nr:response regulator [Geothermobacteraceae bacterium]